jgi:unsaturated chondroitin disaccharide hydrolase
VCLALTVAPPAAGAETAPDRILGRLAELHRLAHGATVEGTDPSGGLRLTSGWMSGFWPGALWQAAAAGAPSRYRRWALQATQAVYGHERDDTHDVGFIYGRSAAAGYDLLCRHGRPLSSTCRRLRAHALAAAHHMLAMMARTPGGLLPTSLRRCDDCAPDQVEAIIDSLANMPLLAWAQRVTGRRRFGDAARRHALRIVGALTRADGSTAQAVYIDQATGAFGAIHTHQGLSASSRWSRGQAWAVYGLARLAGELRSARLGALAERAAASFRRLDPDGRVPRWDFDAATGPPDSSASAVAAAGHARLAEWERQAGRPRAATASRAYARRLLRGLTPYVDAAGRLSGQTYIYGGPDSDENTEFMMGDDYALEAWRLLGWRTHGD